MKGHVKTYCRGVAVRVHGEQLRAYARARCSSCGKLICVNRNGALRVHFRRKVTQV